MTSEKETASLRGKLFSDKQGFLISVSEDTPQTIKFSAQGGGFQHEMTREQFLETFQPAEMPPYRAAKFTADWLPDGFFADGYTNGRRWNGWAMPFFTKEAGLKLTQEMPDLKFDEAANAFVNKFEDDDPAAPPSTYPAELLVVEGASVTVYAIGAGDWCWDLAD